jgi:hypothetical protein
MSHIAHKHISGNEAQRHRSLLSHAARRARASEYATLLLIEDRLLRQRKSRARERVQLLVEVEARLAALRGALGIVEPDEGRAVTRHQREAQHALPALAHEIREAARSAGGAS